MIAKTWENIFRKSNMVVHNNYMYDLREIDKILFTFDFFFFPLNFVFVQGLT